MSTTSFRALAGLMIIALALGACNLPSHSATPTLSEAGAIFTAAAQTVQAQLTQVSQPLPTGPGYTLPAGTSAPPVMTPTPGGGTPTSKTCDLASFVKDVTIPDNSNQAPGSTFVKTWRLENAGSCTWTPDYSLIFVSGDSMGAPASVPLNTTVAPGSTVDVSVTFQAPESDGNYRSDWKLRNASNLVFGTGSDGAKSFWVQINVGAAAASGITLDFLARADSADWVSGSGSTLDTPLNFGDTGNDAIGTARIMNRALLETGAISGKILLTAPKLGSEGVIAGTYPTYTVQSGDHFKARLGFILPSGSCGQGKVIFRLAYKTGDQQQTLQQWGKSCDGKFIVADVDLSSLKGQTVRFVLEVMANGAAKDNWAIWNSARIEHP
jgi:Ig-like domain from next to BRCA1 gene